jgi:hypothetical protein
MCFIWRSVLQNCVKLLNFHKVSKLFKWISLYLAEKHFRIFCTFCIYCFIIFIWRWGIWTLNFLLQWGICRHFLHRWVENLISQISKNSNSRGRPGGHVEVSNWSIH